MITVVLKQPNVEITLHGENQYNREGGRENQTLFIMNGYELPEMSVSKGVDHRIKIKAAKLSSSVM